MKTLSMQISLVLLLLISVCSIGLAQSEIVTPVAGSGSFGVSTSNSYAPAVGLANPRGISVDATGNLYFADSLNYHICKVTPEGVLSIVAGNGSSEFSGDGGPAISAGLNGPISTAIDSLGNLYIAEKWGHRVRKVNPAGIISTVAGIGSQGFSGDGDLATLAELSNPQRVAVDAAGDLFIADSGNNRIRKVNSAGIISTVAGNGTAGFGGDGGPATSAKLSFPLAVSVDTAGNLFIADYSNNRIRKVTPAGVISTVAGTRTSGFSGDGGPATSAKLNDPQGIAADAAGNLFIADNTNNRIRKVNLAGIIDTVVGSGRYGNKGDGGAPLNAQMLGPSDVAADAMGTLYFIDWGNNRIRKVQGLAAVATYFSQVAVGEGSSTHFTLINTGATASTAKLTLTDPDGNPLTVRGELKNPDGSIQNLTGSSFSIVLPPGGVGFVTANALNSNDPIRVGWARLVNSKGALGATATYEFADHDSLRTMVGVSPIQPVRFASVPVDNDDAQHKQLAFAIVNPSGQDITIKMALVDQDGTVLEDTATLTLGPGEHFGRYLWQDFDAMNFRGSLVLRGEGMATFTMIPLLDKQGMYTGLPLISGKSPAVPD